MTLTAAQVAEPIDPPSSLTALVEAAGAAPDAVAVRRDGATMTYRQLRDWSDALATDLDRLRLPPGSPVAVRVADPFGLPVAVLAVMKAGHFWVPIGPDDPPPGRLFAAVVGEPDLRGHRTVPARADRVPCTLAGAVPVPGDAGRVLLAQAPLADLLRATAETLGLRPGHRVLLPATEGPASGLVDVLLGLATGAEVIHATSPAPDALAAAVLAHRPHVLRAAPAVWRELLVADPPVMPELAAVSAGFLPDDLAERLGAVARVWEACGPPETAGYGLLCRPGQWTAAVPKGPAAVLDPRGLPAGDGDGALYLADGGEAIGYFGQPPSLTALAFRPDPSGNQYGGRLCPTGHAVRWGPVAAGGPAEVASGQRAYTPEERTVARIWVELLGIPEPPAEANFFEVGGHSLAVTRLSYLLERSFGMPVPVADLFVHTSVAAQARLLERLYQHELTDLT